MTEEEWLDCTDPGAMLDFLAGNVSYRKLRLFACACCRRIWGLLEKYCGQFAIELLELEENQLAYLGQLDPALAPVGRAVEVTRSQATRAALESVLSAGVLRVGYLDFPAVSIFDRLRRAASLIDAAESCADSAATAAEAAGMASRDAERAEQARLLREVIGNPFYTPQLDPSWIRWNDWTVRRLVREIDFEESYEEMPVLGDALEDAGCTEPDLLEHCRQTAPHFRGCWVLDLVLDRQ
jgi:hypothetical protein